MGDRYVRANVEKNSANERGASLALRISIRCQCGEGDDNEWLQQNRLDTATARSCEVTMCDGARLVSAVTSARDELVKFVMYVISWLSK